MKRCDRDRAIGLAMLQAHAAGGLAGWRPRFAGWPSPATPSLKRAAEPGHKET